jgi:hypothetical protein
MFVALAIALATSAGASDAVVNTGANLSQQPPVETGLDAISIPRLLSYQGKMTDNSGNAVPDTTYSVAFRLYTVASGGTAFWDETQTVRTRSGLFSALLGSVTPIGSMPDAGTAYLEMAVAGGTELTPRLRISSTAYAYLAERAANSDLLQGRDTTTFSRSTHNHDATYVNEGQASSVTSTMITDATVAAADLGQMGAATGQVMKWTGSAWAPRNDSVGQGVTGPVRGSDIVKPCTLAASVGSPNAILHVRNDGGGAGLLVHRALDGVRVDTATLYGLNVQQANAHGVLVNNATTAGMYIQRSGLDGIEVWRSPQYGVFVDSAGSAGLNVTRSNADGVRVRRAMDGVHVDTATQYGLNVQQANVHGVFVNNATTAGMYIQRTGLDGIEVWRSPQYGVLVDSAGSAGLNVTRSNADGVRVRRATDGVHVDTATQYGFNVQQASVHGVLVGNSNNVGLYVGRAGLDGVEVWRSGYNGVLVDSTGSDGVRVLRPESSGLRVKHARFRGVHVDTSDNDGVNIGRAGASGAYVGTAGTCGLWVDSSGIYGVLVNRAGTNGVYVHRARDYGLRVDTAGTAALYIDRLSGTAVKVHFAWSRGLDIDTAGSFGVFVKYSNFVGVEATANNFGFRGYGNVAGGSFAPTSTYGVGVESHALGDTATKTAIKAYGKGLATGGWSTGFADGTEAPCIVASDRSIVASGSGRISAGAATISYPAVFAEHLRPGAPIRVTLTPRGDPAGLLSVRESKGDGFTAAMKRVPGLTGDASPAFDWVAVGTLEDPVTVTSTDD